MKMTARRPISQSGGRQHDLFRSFLLLVAACGLGLAPGAFAAEFIGSDGNWFEASNWSTGVVPDAATNVQLLNGTEVVIDPAVSAGPVEVRDLTIGPGATLRTLAGTVLRYNLLVIDGGSLEGQSSDLGGDELSIKLDGPPVGGWGAGLGSTRLNPTTNDTRSIKIVANTAVLEFFLAGTDAAGPGTVGMGRYPTLLADDVELGGRLRLASIYGFAPAEGDRFQIVTARNSLTGTFDGLEEGAIAGNVGGLDLVITYQGGDGDDVVLTAQLPVAVSVPTLGSTGLMLVVGLIALFGALFARRAA